MSARSVLLKHTEEITLDEDIVDDLVLSSDEYFPLSDSLEYFLQLDKV